jgi:hypothetical protein
MDEFLAEYYKHGNAPVIMCCNVYPSLEQLFTVCHDFDISLFLLTLTPQYSIALLQRVKTAYSREL